MKRLGKYKAVIALLCFTATIFSGCGKKTDAVITDGGDVTVVSAEHETVEESSADIFTYKDLKIGNVSYLMTESQVMAILGKPTEETETNGKKIYSYNEMSIGFQKLNNNNKPDWNGTYAITGTQIIRIIYIYQKINLLNMENFCMGTVLFLI